jgi:APA family basic amino acid/polyamine antiporter
MSPLARLLGLWDLIMLIIAAVIGSGIFLVPGTVLSQVNGSIGVALIVWLLGGILSLLGALTYGELSAANPKAGGLYVYIRDCFGPLPAFLFGWALFFAIGTGAVATLAVAFSDTLSAVVPLSPAFHKMISLAMLLVVAAVNVRGTRQSADLQNVTTAIKAGVVFVMSVILLWFGQGLATGGGSLWPERISPSLGSGGALAMIAVLWAYEGWQYATYSAGEIVDARKNYPKAFLIGTVLVAGLYLLANVAYFAALGAGEVMQSKSVAADAIARIGSPAGAQVLAAAISVSIFSAANAITLTASRVYYAMAGDGLFFRRLAEVHPRFGTPAFAVIAGSVWAVVLALTGTFQQLLTYVVFVGWFFYGLGAASIFVYRKRIPSDSLPYRVPWYPWTPLLFTAAAGLLVANTLVTQIVDEPLRTALALGIILLGVPAYLIWRSRRDR